ncbi:MAG TPA: isochorismate synthase [Cytophagales bacterium]|nr:isochorismate synthase [Cytophagales bacterium]HCR53423.1 isochorismate synthase [Cytophagales bacterium]
MTEVTGELKIQRAEKELITGILSENLTDGNAIGLWRLPNSSKKHLIVCTEGPAQLDELPIEELGTGFVFAPFDSKKQKYFLKANKSCVFEKGEMISNNFIKSSYQDEVPRKLDHSPLAFYQSQLNGFSPLDKGDYIQLVDKSLEQINTGHFEKLVPSRCKKVVLPEQFELIEAFNKLCALYPNAFVSLVSIPEVGTWLGASPELLVSVDHQMHFKTVAVAGTQAVQSDADLKQVAWTQKEIEEQALVCRYIINCFKKIRLREYVELGPKTWKAGNLLHLKTEYEVDMNATNFPQLGSVMLKLLHPTSAVCGMPREASLAFLEAHENFDRSFYSGYLGPVNYENEISLFVNLRCMQWCGHEALLYAGAGVTADSVPQKEWEETEMKMKTLLQVIQS